MEREAKRIATEIIRHRNERICIVTHIDADGIAAGSIASIALNGVGIEHSMEFVKQLDEITLTKIKEKYDFIWFTDLGSGCLSQLKDVAAAVTDHHAPDKNLECGKKDLYSFDETILHFNPHLFGTNGATDLSGAGATYLVAKQILPDNSLMLQLAIVGAVGDLQDAADCKLVGENAKIVDCGVSLGVLERKMDIRFFGRETRPVFKLLQYSNDPILPGLSGSEDACISFLIDHEIRLKDEEKWRSWVDLTVDEKRKIISALVKLLIHGGSGHAAAERLVGEVYILTTEETGTELRDAKEFATLLNACGRYEKAIVGYKVCLGDRSEYFKSAQILLAGHRRTLVDGIRTVKELGIIRMKNIQYFNAGDKIIDTVIGTVAGMLLNSGEVDTSIPIIALSEVKDTERGEGMKASSRAARALIKKGLDLSFIMKNASESVGGFGGGHNIAAGGFVPKGREKEFLEIVDKLVGEQLKG